MPHQNIETHHWSRSVMSHLVQFADGTSWISRHEREFLPKRNHCHFKRPHSTCVVACCFSFCGFVRFRAASSALSLSLSLLIRLLSLPRGPPDEGLKYLNVHQVNTTAVLLKLFCNFLTFQLSTILSITSANNQVNINCQRVLSLINTRDLIFSNRVNWFIIWTAVFYWELKHS